MVRFLLFAIGFLWTATTFAQSWLSYYDSSAVYWGKDWEKTIDLLNKSLPLAEKEIGREHPNFAVLLNDLGISYWRQGNFQLAESHLERSLRLKRNALGESDPEYIATLLNMAGLFRDMGKIAKAENLYLDVLAYYQESTYKEAYYTTALEDLGKLYEEDARYDLAEKQYLQALTYLEQSSGKEHPTYAEGLYSLGGLYQKMGKIKEAEEHYLEALHIYKENQNRTMDYATALNNYGMFQVEKGFFGEAEKLLKEAREIIMQNRGTQSVAYASVLNNFGSLYWRMGNQEASESSYTEALTLYKALLPTNSPELAAALNNMAGYYVGIQDFEKALPLYLKAKEIYADYYGKKHPLYASALNNLASLHRKRNDYAQAEKLYLEVLKIEKDVLGENHPQYASSLQNMGLLNVAMGEYERASDYMHQAIAIKSKILPSQHPSWAKTYNNLALLYFLQGNLEAASPLFEKALTNQFHQIKNVFPALSEKEKENFYNTLKDDIERFNTFALARYEEDSTMAGVMYNNQLVTKGLLFDASTKVRENIFQSQDKALIEQYNNWRKLRDELARAYQSTNEILTRRGIKVKELENQVNVLEKELSAKSFALNPQSDWQQLTWKDIRDTLSPGEAAIEMVRFRRFKIQPQTGQGDESDDFQTGLLYGWTEQVNYAALIITSETKKTPKLVLLRDGKSLESRHFSYYKNAIRYQVKDSLSFQYFWGAIQEAIPQVKTVYFSPDGAYYKINLNTLFDPVADIYVLDTLQIRQLTSTRDLMLASANDESTSKDAILIGAPDFNYTLENNPILARGNEVQEVSSQPLARVEEVGLLPPTIRDLPGTKTEVEKISVLLSKNHWEPQKFLGKNALEENLKEVNSPKVLHIATHGYFKDTPKARTNQGKNPLLNSGLLFAGAQNSLNEVEVQNPAVSSQAEDGVLTAFEAMNLKLDHTDLVVLSACETGSGTIKNGEGVYGLQRAFQVAGASSIVFSLWKVNDEATQKLMTYFYERWMHTDDKREAFELAQQKLREEYPHPYYWGAFILIGE